MQLSNQQLNYSITGAAGPWLVFLHGFCEQQSLWDDVLPTLNNYRILTLDLPGFGESKGHALESLFEMGAEVEKLLKQLEIEKPIIFGHSMGGYLAANMIVSEQLKPRALAMVHSTFSADSNEKKQNRLKTIEFLDAHPLSSFLKVFVEGLFAPNNAANGLLIEKARTMVSNNEKTAVIAALRAMMNRNDKYEWLQNTSLPILMLAGKEDAHVPLATSIKEASLCRRGSLIILDNCGHLGQFEQPLQVKTALENFILWADALQLN
jgi:pimeloyl-ACP methyl ester carboxylesterase